MLALQTLNYGFSNGLLNNHYGDNQCQILLPYPDHPVDINFISQKMSIDLLVLLVGMSILQIVVVVLSRLNLY
jgi:hypothetical protein